MAKMKAAGELCGSIGDSDCGDSIASPSSDGRSYSPSCSDSQICADSPGTSGIDSCSEIDEPSLKHIKQEMDNFDVNLIPKPVRDNEAIMKPPDPGQDISFASLLKNGQLEDHVRSNGKNGHN